MDARRREERITASAALGIVLLMLPALALFAMYPAPQAAGDQRISERDLHHCGGHRNLPHRGVAAIARPRGRARRSDPPRVDVVVGANGDVVAVGPRAERRAAFAHGVACGHSFRAAEALMPLRGYWRRISMSTGATPALIMPSSRAAP